MAYLTNENIKTEDIILKLLKELKDICTKNDIPYILSDQTAVDACINGKFRDNVVCGHIMIKTSDTQRFIRAAEKEKSKNRTLDYLGKNPKLNGLYLRYTDDETTSVSMRREIKYLSQGIYIIINLARVPLKKNKKTEKFFSGLEKAMFCASTFGIKYNAMRIISANLFRAFTLGKNKKIMTKFFNYFIEIYSGDGTKKKYFRKSDYSDIAYFSKTLFENRDNVILENMSFSIPRNKDEFFTSIFGRGWEMKINPYPPFERYRSNVLSPEICYKDFINAYGRKNLKAQYRNSRNSFTSKGKKKVREANDYSVVTWYIVVYAAAVMELKKLIDKKMLDYDDEYVKALFEKYATSSSFIGDLVNKFPETKIVNEVYKKIVLKESNESS